MDVDERRRVKIQGRGRYRRYSAKGLLKVCWGFPWVCKKVNKSCKDRTRQQHKTPNVISRRSSAHVLGTEYKQRCANHISRCRKAMSELVLLQTKRKLHDEGFARHIFLEISADETEVGAKLESSNEICSLLMCHASVSLLNGHSCKHHELICPPRVVQGTSSNILMPALLSRVQDYFSFQVLLRQCWTT